MSKEMGVFDIIKAINGLNCSIENQDRQIVELNKKVDEIDIKRDEKLNERWELLNILKGILKDV